MTDKSQPAELPVEPNVLLEERERILRGGTEYEKAELTALERICIQQIDKLKAFALKEAGWRKLSPCELMAGNQQLLEWGKHWEQRAEKAESELAALRGRQGAIEELVEAAEDVDVSSQGIRGQALFDALEKLNRSE